MTDFISFIIGPIGRYIAIAFAASVLIGGLYLKVRHEGYKAAIEAVERQDQRAKQASEEAGIDVDACYERGAEWVWSIERGKCFRR